MYLITAKKLEITAIDLGNLMAFDPIIILFLLRLLGEMVKEAIEQGTKLVKAVADALFSLPSTEDPDGPIVVLSAPTTKLPREKPLFLQIRDIASKPEWERLYQYEMPVLDRVREDDTELDWVASTNKKTKAALATA
ncbi:hypothetical protein OROHE_000414 [Orobanche hederae]